MLRTTQAVMKNTSKTAGTEKQITAALEKINAEIAALQVERAGLADGMKQHYADLKQQLSETEIQIKDLDPTWRPPSLRPKADAKIVELLTAKGQPMTQDEIMKELGGTFSNWKLKAALKKRSSGAKAVFAVNDGRYSLKAAA